jgi:hypothetical protein
VQRSCESFVGTARELAGAAGIFLPNFLLESECESKTETRPGQFSIFGAIEEKDGCGSA